MYGLPQQTLAQAMTDLRSALTHNTRHISWYQLTIEPHTAFYAKRPKTPQHDQLMDMHLAGQKLLARQQYLAYEVSAYTQNTPCHHNLNYWQFGDYLGIGAGAHSKLTCSKTKIITRQWQVKHPQAYMETKESVAGSRTITEEEKPLEYMMNRLRLPQLLTKDEYQNMTQCNWDDLVATMRRNDLHQWATIDKNSLELSTQGQHFIDEILTWFVPEQV